MGLMPRQNNNPKGILYILLSMMVFSVQDGIMKHIYNINILYYIIKFKNIEVEKGW